jgi:hypothetical protein
MLYQPVITKGGRKNIYDNAEIFIPQAAVIAEFSESRFFT